MSRKTELQQQARLARWVARVPTEGGHIEDRVLLAVAYQLEREAARLEEISPPPPRHGFACRSR
jgi:hypothetical protein